MASQQQRSCARADGAADLTRGAAWHAEGRSSNPRLHVARPLRFSYFTDVAAGLGRGEQVTALLKGDLVFGRVLKLRPVDHSARLWPPVPRMEPGRLGRLRIARWRSSRPGDHPAPGDEKIVGGALGVCGFSLGAKVTRGDSLHRIVVSPLARRPHSRRPLEDSRLHWLGKHRAGRHKPALAPKRLHMTSVTQLL